MVIKLLDENIQKLQPISNVLSSEMTLNLRQNWIVEQIWLPGNVHNHNLIRYNSETFQVSEWVSEFQLKSNTKPLHSPHKIPSDKILMMLREMILLQLRYDSVNANFQYIAQEGDHSPKYPQMLYNYLICCRQLPLESSIKQQVHWMTKQL